jgi:ppGpp synthetase/RelA/SpoT-type nucleotidyltranferase
MAWAEPLYTIQEVNAAGKILVASRADNDEWWDENFEAYLHALDVVNNWRGAHAYPLNTFQIYLRNTARRFEARPLVAQRIKRMVSIENKLSMQTSMKLSQMQDLGGCRAIMANVAGVRSVVNYYREQSAIKHVIASTDNYIDNPKKSGYRGVHLVYRYHSDKNKKMYNNLKIEMQIRSRYQHAWATAVETVSMFSGQALKSSLGSDEWKRFFSLMGSAIALREGSSLVPNTPTNKTELIAELQDIANSLQVEHRLSEYNKALHSISSGTQDAFFYLMTLDPASRTLSVRGYGEKEGEEASAKYAEAEREAKSRPGTDAVLVSVESVGSLAKAYPNYFADTRLFVELLKQALAGRTRSIRVPDLKVGQLKFFFKEELT